MIPVPVRFRSAALVMREALEFHRFFFYIVSSDFVLHFDAFRVAQKSKITIFLRNIRMNIKKKNAENLSSKVFSAF